MEKERIDFIIGYLEERRKKLEKALFDYQIAILNVTEELKGTIEKNE